MTIGKISISVAAIMLFGAVTPASTQQNEQGAGGEIFEKVQSEFAEAYNHKDIGAMAAFFRENGVRIRPAGESPVSQPLISDDVASHSGYAGTMSDSPGLIALRKSLGDSSPELPPETPKQMAHDAIRQILDAIESGVCPLGDWERRCLGAAITSLRGGHTHEARSRARQALWPEENRRNAAIAKFPVRPGMASVAELKREFEAARAMPGRARRRGAETV